MERTINYQGRRFQIRAYEVEGGFTEGVTEYPEGGIGYVADWDGSGIVYPTADICLEATDALVRTQIDADLENDEYDDTDR